MTKLFIHAANIHQGGGRSLLSALFEVLPDKFEVIVLIDSRMPILESMPENVEIKKVKPYILQRFMAEHWLVKNVSAEDILLFFGNLPPLFKLRGHAIVFVQNRYLIDKVGLAGFSFRNRLRISIERLWFNWFASHADEFITQTFSMKTLLESRLGKNVPVHVMPFVSISEGYTRGLGTYDVKKNSRYDFLYVASGEPHKNHQQLVEAWCLLAAENLFPSLCLTLNEAISVDLWRWINEKKNQYGLHLENLSLLQHGQIKQLYSQSGALIYPSNLESFGLPLIEARQAGLPILAPELDYVRDIIDPEETFNPDSPLSIARAVKRFMGIQDKSLPLMNASEFIKHITGRMS